MRWMRSCMPCAAVIICNYLLMTVASRVLMAAFGRIPEKFFFPGYWNPVSDWLLNCGYFYQQGAV